MSKIIEEYLCPGCGTTMVYVGGKSTQIAKNAHFSRVGRKTTS